MTAIRSLNNLYSGWLHLPSCLLPLLVLSVTFTSKPVYPEIILHQIFSMMFMVLAIMVFYRACANQVLAITIIAALVFIRILRYADASEILVVIYFIPYSILLLVVGAKLVRDYPVLMLRQVMWICVISIILSLMQITGVQWAQSLTNFYWQLGGENEKYLFVQWQNLPPIQGIQVRPVGFASANNIVSQYLLFFYAFAMIWFSSKQNRLQPPLIWLFMISFACALTGAKVVIAGMILIQVAIWVLSKRQNYLCLVKSLSITVLAYCVYWILFPGLFVFNFNLDLFSYNLMLRLADLFIKQGVPITDEVFMFLANYNTGEFIGQKNLISSIERSETESITGIGSMVRFAWVIVPVVATIIPLWFYQMRRLQPDPYIDRKNLSIIMAVAAVASSAGGPFLLTSYFWFFFAIAMYPLSRILLKDPDYICCSSNETENQYTVFKL